MCLNKNIKFLIKYSRYFYKHLLSLNKNNLFLIKNNYLAAGNLKF